MVGVQRTVFLSKNAIAKFLVQNTYVRKSDEPDVKEVCN